jgi:4-hydroxy-tetrahydrodipicolinate synthase
LVTPFKNGAVDWESYRALVARQVAAGVDFLVPLGSTAETPCLEDDEKVRLLAMTREAFSGTVVVGVGTNSLQATLRNIRLLEPCGPDAYLVVVPYYNKPTQEGMYQYFKAVAESTDKAVVLYNVPGRTGSNIKPETVLRLAQIPNIVAIKEASGDISQILAIRRAAPESFSVLSGNDDQTCELMQEGADGVVSVASNVFPSAMVDFVHALQAGKFAEAARMNERLAPLFKALFVEPSPIPAKAAMAQLGLMENNLRLPLVPATEKTEELIKQTLKDLF